MYNFSILLNHNKIFKNISNINTSKNSYMQKKKKSFMYNIRIYYNYSSIKSRNRSTRAIKHAIIPNSHNANPFIQEQSEPFRPQLETRIGHFPGRFFPTRSRSPAVRGTVYAETATRETRFHRRAK